MSKEKIITSVYQKQYSREYVKQYDSFLSNLSMMEDQVFVRKELNAYCTSHRCNSAMYGNRKTSRVKYIKKTVPKTTTNCPTCDDFLFWSIHDPSKKGP